jgi:Fe2+ or Zn2+ uptake regulation protein
VSKVGPNSEVVLKRNGIRPSAQRLAIANYVLWTEDHPTAESVYARVLETFPMMSRGTVYNTLNLFVRKGLLRELHLRDDAGVRYDPRLSKHHHFLDQDTGHIYDIPWSELRVSNVAALRGFQVDEYQVVLRGRRR